MQGFHRDKNALIWQMGHEMVRVEPWGRDSLRVRAVMYGPVRDDLPGALLSPAVADAEIEIHKDGAIIRNGAIGATFSSPPKMIASLRDMRIRFFNTTTGAELLAEDPPHVFWPGARYFKPVGGEHFRVEAGFKAYEGERLYGLGQHQHGLLDQKGCVIRLLQQNAEVNIPFLLSSRGYGFLWHNPAVGRVELGRTGTRWVAEAAPQLDYWITTAGTPAGIMANYADATGHPPLLPEWASGFWQCKLRYRTQAELMAVAREHKARSLPLSVIVADYFHWTLQGDWKFDPECWPNPAAMVKELDEMGVKLMVSIWPTVNVRSENFAEMRRRGLLVGSERGTAAQREFHDNRPEGDIFMYVYDATNPEAREFIWEKVKQNYYDLGVKVFWLDADEPELYPMDTDLLRYRIGNGTAVNNIYPMLHAQAFYEGMRAEGEQEIVLLSRSAWAGSQHYGAAVWSGDIASTFEALQAQVRAGLNIALSGIPWWTTDIGGFHGGEPTTPYFRELIVRWFQYGTFCPLFRLHGYRLPAEDGSGADNEVWSFGEEAYDIIKELLFLRERLRPYIMEQMQAAHELGTPPMRPLFFDFPGDDIAYDVEDAFMFGPDLLVAPVLHRGEDSREVYLPDGVTWTDAWTGETFEGGQTITAEAPLDRIPLYLRDGAALPIRG